MMIFSCRHKQFSRGSVAILIAVLVMALILIGTFVAAAAVWGDRTGVQNPDGSIGGMCTAADLTDADKDQIKNNQPIYEAAANASGISWEFLAALHYRENSLRTDTENPFQITGNVNSGFSVASATEAANKAKGLAQGSYGVSLSKSSDESSLKLAFLAYNRGTMYKTGGCSVDDSPYVMNQFDEDHANMKWLGGGCDPDSISGDTDTRLGAFTVYSILKGCSSNAVVSGERALPINPSAITGYNRIGNPHGRTVSHPDSKPGHDAFLGDYPGNSGTGLPPFTLGEAVDLMAKHGTPVFAPFDGKVVFAGSVRGGSAGHVIIIKSADGRSFAVLAHIDNIPSRGTTVVHGQQVGEVFDMSAPHLHFELWVDNAPINAGPFNSNWSPEKVWQAQQGALGF